MSTFDARAEAEEFLSVRRDYHADVAIDVLEDIVQRAYAAGRSDALVERVAPGRCVTCGCEDGNEEERRFGWCGDHGRNCYFERPAAPEPRAGEAPRLCHCGMPWDWRHTHVSMSREDFTVWTAFQASRAATPPSAAASPGTPQLAGKDFCAQCDCIAGNGQRGHHMSYGRMGTERDVFACAFCPHSSNPVSAEKAFKSYRPGLNRGVEAAQHGLSDEHFLCPKCGAHHDRGFYQTQGQYRCIACGYIGPRRCEMKSWCALTDEDPHIDGCIPASELSAAPPPTDGTEETP